MSEALQRFHIDLTHFSLVYQYDLWALLSDLFRYPRCVNTKPPVCHGFSFFFMAFEILRIISRMTQSTSFLGLNFPFHLLWWSPEVLNPLFVASNYPYCGLTKLIAHDFTFNCLLTLSS